MIANYGYRDGSGEFFISIDTDKCNGCGDCVPACPSKLLEMAADEFDPLSEKTVVAVREEERTADFHLVTNWKTISSDQIKREA
ncbi:MAG: 4Fe-4S binding protein [Deltaproteobacteria bacterium]|nr:4Fe-4S binding protein [Deltaproteobacteria bacterium]